MFDSLNKIIIFVLLLIINHLKIKVMKNLFVSFLLSVISFISFSQSVILEYNQFNSFNSDKNFNVLTLSEFLQNKDIKNYQTELCNIKY